ncbi:MAG: zinc ribbon domain-containing protein [Actinobacteria bacterium]|nr:zinc ribbon domain-containing protein [Actinomycetota bacterium]MBU1943739.1 zinc ribbon domain-containing protein [Actinomycetota bacterium]MBU2687074.1 zinc ribbon domain-containing protein [Actinomycetota bacterium]
MDSEEGDGMWFKKKKAKVPEIPKKYTGLVCENCRTEIPGNLNLCPNCGKSPGPQTMTDLDKMDRNK